jgi:hypothetical protein
VNSNTCESRAQHCAPPATADLHRADARQRQQLGVPPAITVPPTLRGLRAGKDEVLDRALRGAELVSELHWLGSRVSNPRPGS